MSKPVPGLVLFGSGRFALGGVLSEYSSDGAAEITVVSRIPVHGAPSQTFDLLDRTKTFWICVQGSDERRRVKISAHLAIGRDDDEILALLRNPRIAVVGTSNLAGQAKVINLMRQAFGDRVGLDLPSLVVVPFENDVDPGWSSLSSDVSLGRPVVVLRALVDRICADLRSDMGRVEVSVEAFREIAVESSLQFESMSEDDLVAIRSIFDSLKIEMSSDLTLALLRKRYLLNGLQMCMAAFARDAGFESMSEFFASSPGAVQSLDGVRNAIVVALVDIGLGVEEAQYWSSFYRERILRLDDSVSRLLRKVLAQSRDDAMLVLDARVGAVLRILREDLPDSKIAQAARILKRLVASEFD